MMMNMRNMRMDETKNLLSMKEFLEKNRGKHRFLKRKKERNIENVLRVKENLHSGGNMKAISLNIKWMLSKEK